MSIMFLHAYAYMYIIATYTYKCYFMCDHIANSSVTSSYTHSYTTTCIANNYMLILVLLYSGKSCNREITVK